MKQKKKNRTGMKGLEKPQVTAEAGTRRGGACSGHWAMGPCGEAGSAQVTGRSLGHSVVGTALRPGGCSWAWCGGGGLAWGPCRAGGAGKVSTPSQLWAGRAGQGSSTI